MRVRPGEQVRFLIGVTGLALASAIASYTSLAGGFVLIPKGVLFVLLVTGMYLILPNEDLRHRRGKVPNEILPRQDKP